MRCLSDETFKKKPDAFKQLREIGGAYNIGDDASGDKNYEIERHVRLLA